MEVKANWHECWWSQFHQLFDSLFFTSHHQTFFNLSMKINCFSAFNLSRPLFLAKSTPALIMKTLLLPGYFLRS